MTEAEQDRVFEEWLRKHKRLLFTVVRSYARDPMDRDDLFQEISVQVWRSIPAFRQESAVTTWLYRVALNTAMSWSRKERRRLSVNDPASVQSYILIETEHHDDRLDWLYGEISLMDPIDKSLVLLLLDGFSYEEMASVMGITESNVGVKVHRLKKYLINRANENRSWSLTK